MAYFEGNNFGVAYGLFDSWTTTVSLRYKTLGKPRHGWVNKNVQPEESVLAMLHVSTTQYATHVLLYT
jgi:hypothetical protein